MQPKDTPDSPEAWLPLDDIGEAKLILTDALIQAQPQRAAADDEPNVATTKPTTT